MSTYGEKYAAMAGWRKAVSAVLLVAAIAILVLDLVGALHGAAIAVALVVVVLSLAVGPRSPFFGD